MIAFLAIACQGEKRETVLNDEVPIETDTTLTVDDRDTVATGATKTYSNERFRDVVVEKVGDNEFKISGKGQIFEASFGWVVEDGHNELEKGFEMTDAGAPAWGNFSFRVNAKKAQQNSTLHLILFETSAKDGSRQHELPIKLY